jgi:hypothetical protein
MAKATSGPLEVKINGFENPRNIVDANGWLVAKVFATGNDDNIDANAALLARAPQLLNVLRRFTYAVKSTPPRSVEEISLEAFNLIKEIEKAEWT